MGAVLSWLAAHGPLLGTVLYVAWQHFAGTKAKDLATRVREAVTAAWHNARMLVATNVADPVALEGIVLAKATAALKALGITLDDATQALIKHELDLLAADLAKEQLALRDAAETNAAAHLDQWAPLVEQLLGKVADGTQDVVAEFERARVRGAATGAALHEHVETTLVPPDETLAQFEAERQAEADRKAAMAAAELLVPREASPP